MCDIQHAVDEQAEAAQAMMETGEPVSHRDEIKKRFNMLFIKFEANNRIASFEVNREKQDALLLTAGFFASKTVGVDLDPLAARDNYGMRDEQEKAFALQKGALGQDRLRTWSETGKHGRMFITFIGLILASYVRATWKETSFSRRSSVQQRLYWLKCAPYAVSNTVESSSLSPHLLVPK